MASPAVVQGEGCLRLSTRMQHLEPMKSIVLASAPVGQA